jgi:hypothetical protein
VLLYVGAFLGMFPGSVPRVSTDVTAGVVSGPFAVCHGVRQDMAAGTLLEQGESGGKVNSEPLSVHVCGFPHDSCKFPSWVGQEDGEGAGSLGGVGECGLGPDWGLNDGAGAVLEVLAKFCFELCQQREFAVGMVVDGDVLESNSHLSFIGDEGKDVLPERA